MPESAPRAPRTLRSPCVSYLPGLRVRVLRGARTSDLSLQHQNNKKVSRLHMAHLSFTTTRSATTTSARAAVSVTVSVCGPSHGTHFHNVDRWICSRAGVSDQPRSSLHRGFAGTHICGANITYPPLAAALTRKAHVRETLPCRIYPCRICNPPTNLHDIFSCRASRRSLLTCTMLTGETRAWAGGGARGSPTASASDAWQPPECPCERGAGSRLPTSAWTHEHRSSGSRRAGVWTR